MATLQRTIAASADDALQDGVSMNTNGATPTVNATTKYAGFRFTNITIAPGSTVSAATLTLYLPSAANDDADVDIYGEDADDAATFTTANNDITNRTATTAVAVWTAGSLGTGWKVSADFAAVIQEIIDRGGWASGNDIVIVLKGRSTDPLRFETYDAATGNLPTLDITYTAPGGGSGAAARAYHLRMQGIS